VVGGVGGGGVEFPPENCSQAQFVRLRDMNINDYRIFTKGQCQDCYKSLKGPLTKVLAGYNASGQHNGDFSTPDGTDEWARFCQGNG